MSLDIRNDSNTTFTYQQEGKTVAMACKVGDRVLLPPYGGNNVKLGEEEYILFRDSEILGKLE